MAGAHVKPRAGSWRPGGYTPGVMLVLLWTITVGMVGRGVVYLSGTLNNEGTLMTVVEESMPMWAWGALLLAASGLIVVGQVARVYWGIIGGAVLACGTYSALAVGALLSIPEGGSVRVTISLAVIAALWAGASFGTADKRRREDARERIVNGEH